MSLWSWLSAARKKREAAARLQLEMALKPTRDRRDRALDRIAAIAGIEIERDLTGVADAYVPPEGKR